jgi:hypothetical protein
VPYRGAAPAELRERLDKEGIDPVGRTPDEFRAEVVRKSPNGAISPRRPRSIIGLIRKAAA